MAAAPARLSTQRRCWRAALAPGRPCSGTHHTTMPHTSPPLKGLLQDCSRDVQVTANHSVMLRRGFCILVEPCLGLSIGCEASGPLSESLQSPEQLFCAGPGGMLDAGQPGGHQALCGGLCCARAATRHGGSRARSQPPGTPTWILHLINPTAALG